MPRYKKEQVEYRKMLLKTNPIGRVCLETNECPCKCTTSDVLLSDLPCSENCFPHMMSRADWYDFKLANKLIF